jgi:hypothetical protein
MRMRKRKQHSSCNWQADDIASTTLSLSLSFSSYWFSFETNLFLHFTHFTFPSRVLFSSTSLHIKRII